MSRKLIYLFSFVVVLALVGSTSADLQLVENFTTLTGPDGMACTGVLGGTWDTQSANTGNVVVETNSGSMVVRFMSTTTGAGRGVGFNGITNTIDNSETGMAFFRFMLRSDAQVPRTYIGLISDTSADPITGTNTDTPTNIPVGFGLLDNGSGGFNLVKTDGTTVLKSGFVRTQWYNVWIVADNANDVFDLYLSTATGPAGAATLPTSGDLVAGNIPFGVATSVPLTGMIFASPTAAVQSTRCYIDEIYWDGTQGLATKKTSASAPSPANNKTDVPREVVLGWEPGIYAQTHDVYFGTDTTAVQNATTNDTSGIYRGRKPKDPASYDPPETLNFSKIYYWRVDEVNGPLDYTIYPGSVWSFTAEPFAYPITPIAATASSSSDANMVPGKTIDGSGLNSSDQHSIVRTNMWLSSATGPQPTWIQYEFDKVYKLHQMWVWNYNGESILTKFGLRNVTIKYSTDNANWTQLSGVPEFTQATGLATYVHDYNEIAFGGVAAKYVRITANSNWGGVGYDQYGLSEVRFFHIPVRAREPSPASGATGVGLDNIVLSWRAGREAVSHKVYFSSNSGAVISGTALVGTVGTNSYNPGPLELGRTYYWKIDEVNTAATPTTWQGDVWRFTTGDYFVVDDFESYTNSDPNIIFKTWKDGVGYSPGNGTGSQAGYRDPNYAEMSIIHGGIQAMPVDYNNTKPPFCSEVDRTPIQDWSDYGINLLSLWLRGHPVSVGSFVRSGYEPNYIYTMTAVGTDIWNVPDLRPHPSLYHDEFRYAYTQVSGNYAIIAKVDSITNTNAYAKAGVMIRDSLDANSAEAMTCLTPSAAGGIRLQHRATAGGTSAPTDANIVSINPPYWVYLQRKGNEFKAYYSLTGEPYTWFTLGSTITFTMTDPIYIGLALTSHNTAASCTAVFSNVHLYNVNPDDSLTEVTPLPSLTSKDIGIKNNVAAPLYVTLKDSNNNAATITHDDPNIALATTYQEWLIPMARFTFLNSNLDLANIQKITLGIGGAGSRGTGTLYFDDIRLYGSRCMSGRPGPAADFNGDCFVDYNDLNRMTTNWLISDYQVIPQAPGTTNLAAHWKLDEISGTIAADSSSNNHHNGTVAGTPQWVTGNVDGALDFNGVANYIDVNDPNIVVGSFSLALWAKPRSIPYTTGYRSFMQNDVWTGSTGSVHVHLRNTTSLFNVEINGGVGVYANTALQADQWCHLAATIDAAGRVSKVYVNGVLDNTATGTGTATPHIGPMNIGAYQNNSRYFDGVMDDIRIYNRVLSHNEIASLADKPTFTQPLYPLLTPQNPAINMYEDGAIDLRDYAVLANTWLEEPLLWPPQLKSVWAYEFKNDANCYDPGPPTEARDLHLEFNGAVYLIDTGPFTSFAGNGTSKITLSGGAVAANRSTVIRVGTTGAEKTLNKWWWTDATHQRISKEMTGVGPSCKKIN